MTTHTAPKKRIIIVGAGAFGLSTALYLQRYHKQHVDVLLLDSQPFPSVDSASGNDTSRAIRPDYTDSFYSNLAKDAMHAWSTDPVFSSHYKQSGRLAAAAPGVPFLQRCRETLKTVGLEVEEFGEMDKAQNLKKKFPMLGDVEKLKGWDFYYNPHAGWANPKEAVISAMKEYQALGGKFIGDSKRGKVVDNLIVDGDDNQLAAAITGRIVGVKTADGRAHHAEHVIYAIGSFSTSQKTLLPGLETQIHPTGFAIAHWKLDDPDELKAWLHHPVVDMYHFGYFFPPDPSTHLMKLGLGIMGFTHDHETDDGDTGVGIARANSALAGSSHEGRIPPIAEEGIRWILSHWAPSLAQKKFFDMKMCWDAMTPDGGWLIDNHPQVQGLSVATGGSGHGFKFLPVVGQFICEALNLVQTEAVGSVTPRSTDHRKRQMREKWKWGRKGNLNVKDRRVALQGRPILNVVEHLESDRCHDIDSIIRSRL
ncbi:hypothetical protein UA08_06354 [Talaromyces atroroseus]|uniref:FAD dependent oxidoreductase domain-containing protein n=1 Tax=Talaromyces atroroseus TaxID=1441469 RepID=A0A225AVL6_TALAT|nr:hypothetical protein UA08_06354 [Talaromyces atroroseus]OKL58475.1 hypothetical protein UA08_06354 [Talaromyces atroroseus]